MGLINISKKNTMVEPLGHKELAQQQKDEHHIEVWKVKRLIKKLQNARGNGTSFVSLYIPPKDQLQKVMGHLN